MKRFFYVAICAATSFAIISCGNSNTTEATQQQAETNTVDNAIADSIAKAKADSIAKIQAIEKAKADSIAKAKADSLEKLNNPHPDLKLFDLRGPVKSCKKGTKDYYTILNFTESGELTSANSTTDSYQRKYKIHRKNGKIAEISYNKHDLISGYSDVFITDNNGHIKEINSWDQDCSYENKFQRNENGLITKETIHELCGPDDDYYYTTHYSNYQFDKYGNWIKRTAKTEYGTNVETRTITYY